MWNFSLLLTSKCIAGHEDMPKPGVLRIRFSSPNDMEQFLISNLDCIKNNKINMTTVGYTLLFW